MPTLASAATGIRLELGTTAIPEITNISDIGAQFEVVDVSAHDGGNWASKIPTLLDGGTIRVEANLVPGNVTHIALRTAMMNRTSSAFRVVLPTVGNPMWTFNAFVTSWRMPSTPVRGALPLAFDLTVDGAMAFS